MHFFLLSQYTIIIIFYIKDLAVLFSYTDNIHRQFTFATIQIEKIIISQNLPIIETINCFLSINLIKVNSFIRKRTKTKSYLHFHYPECSILAKQDNYANHIF